MLFSGRGQEGINFLIERSKARSQNSCLQTVQKKQENWRGSLSKVWAQPYMSDTAHSGFRHATSWSGWWMKTRLYHTGWWRWVVWFVVADWKYLKGLINCSLPILLLSIYCMLRSPRCSCGGIQGRSGYVYSSHGGYTCVRRSAGSLTIESGIWCPRRYWGCRRGWVDRAQINVCKMLLVTRQSPSMLPDGLMAFLSVIEHWTIVVPLSFFRISPRKSIISIFRILASNPGSCKTFGRVLRTSTAYAPRRTYFECAWAPPGQPEHRSEAVWACTKRSF